MTLKAKLFHVKQAATLHQAKFYQARLLGEAFILLMPSKRKIPDPATSICILQAEHVCNWKNVNMHVQV